MLTIHLEESDCFAAWLSAKEVGMGAADGSELKRESLCACAARRVVRSVSEDVSVSVNWYCIVRCVHDAGCY